jgi:5-hydroxyisourate hydrolase
MTSLTTHILDTTIGLPGAGMEIRLWQNGTLLFAGSSDGDGRCRNLPDVAAGRYRLEFAASDYFRRAGVALADPPFFDIVSIDFGVADDVRHYHIPLLVSPYSYSTYRGS